jgi:RNA polymerase sigma-70 factor (ECF subfamily)
MTAMLAAQEVSDADVVREVLGGCTEAYATLVRRYQGFLFRHAERMTGSGDEAADIVQMAFVKGYRNLERCRNPERVGAWLFRISANLCKDFLKNRRRLNLSLQDTPAVTSKRDNPGDAAEQSEMGTKIDRALQRLAADQREAFVLKHVEGRSYKEMSDMLEASVPALKMRVHRAREELQTLLAIYR